MPALDAASPLAAYRAAFEAGDVAGVRACLAPAATLESPITDDFEFAGRDQIAAVMEEVVAVVSLRRFHADVGDARHRVLKGSGVVGGVAIDESIHFHLDADGLIERIELYVRPMPGLVTLAAVLGPRIAGRASPARGIAVRAMLAPLAFMTRSGAKLGARLARP
jgi:hypothetical protein